MEIREKLLPSTIKKQWKNRGMDLYAASRQILLQKSEKLISSCYPIRRTGAILSKKMELGPLSLALVETM